MDGPFRRATTRARFLVGLAVTITLRGGLRDRPRERSRPAPGSPSKTAPVRRCRGLSPGCRRCPGGPGRALRAARAARPRVWALRSPVAGRGHRSRGGRQRRRRAQRSPTSATDPCSPHAYRYTKAGQPDSQPCWARPSAGISHFLPGAVRASPGRRAAEARGQSPAPLHVCTRRCRCRRKDGSRSLAPGERPAGRNGAIRVHHRVSVSARSGVRTSASYGSEPGRSDGRSAPLWARAC